MERTIDKVIRLYSLLEEDKITKVQLRELRLAVLNLLGEVINTITWFTSEEGE